MKINEIIDGYLKWEEREKWLLLRDLAYGQLRNRFFSSPEKIDQSSYVDFKKYYLGFCTISVEGSKYKLSTVNISYFLNRYSVSELKGLINGGNIQVIGNASWSQLHMGFRKDKWPDVKDSIKYLLFDEHGKSVSEMNEDEVVRRLGRVLEGDMSVAGFGRAKVTPLLLICDRKGRFGVWNKVSDDALDRLGLKPRSDVTRRRRTSDYLLANKALNELEETYGFRNLADVDIFVWYFLEKTKMPSLKEKRTRYYPLTSKEDFIVLKTIRASRHAPSLEDVSSISKIRIDKVREGIRTLIKLDWVKQDGRTAHLTWDNPLARFFTKEVKRPIVDEYLSRTVPEELYHVGTEATAKVKHLDPYLSTIKEKIEEAEHYLQEERIFPETIVKLSFEAVMYTLMRRIIDLKGIKPIEDLRRQKKLYFETLIGILRNEGEPIDSYVQLELLRDLRNRVEHEAFKATKQNAMWAYNVAKSFISKKYSTIFVEGS